MQIINPFNKQPTKAPTGSSGFERRPATFLVWWFFCACVAACSLWPQPATAARTVLELDAKAQPVDMGDWGDEFLDTTGTLTVSAVIADAKFTPMKLGQPLPTRRGNVQWIRFTIPPAPDAERWYLEIPFSSLDKATLYTHDKSGQWLPSRAGDLVPVTAWPVPARHPLLPVVVSAEEPTRFLLALENNASINAPLRFVSESGWSDKQQRVGLVLGGFFGLCLLVMAYSLLSAFVLRDQNYAVFAFYVAMVMLSQAGISGVGAFVLWPQSPVWADVATLVGNLLAVPTMYRLAARVGGVAARERFWSPLLWTFAAIGLTVLAGLVVFGPQSAYRDVVAPIWTVVSLVPLALVCARGVWLGDRVAPWILVATAPPVLATLWQVAHFMGWVEYGLLGLYGLQLGLVWQFPVMLFALAMRAQERRAVRQRVSDLNRVDGSTGLVLSQVLIYRANLATIRARRNQGQAALLRVDVENAEALRKEFGRKPFADLQLRFAERLLRVMRDIDTVALLDDGQYAVFVDGPVHEHDVRELATKIVARSLKPFTSLNHNLLPKIRITCLMLPWADEDAVRALAALDAAYRKRDPTDRRAIQILTAEEASSANASPQPKKASEEQAGA